MKLSTNICIKLNEYYTTCIARYHYHLKSAQTYKRLYLCTTAPIIIFSSITTVMASYNGNTVDQNLAIAVAIFSGLTTIGQALISFVEYNTQYTTHFAVSNKFMSLARTIETEVVTNYFNTINDVDDENVTKAYVKYLFDKINAEFTAIQDTEPYLHSLLQKKDNYLAFKDEILVTELIPILPQ